MIEYLYDAIRATAGGDNTIITHITQDGESVLSACGMMLHLDDEHAVMIPGACEGNLWHFNIPAELTRDLKGRYWYCFCQENKPLCFKQPIYFV